MAEAIRMSADEQIAQWMRVAEETPEFADEAARAIEFINQRAAEDIKTALEKANPAIEQFANSFAAAFESRGIDALLEGDISDALKGLAKDIIELIVRLTVLKPLAEGLATWFGGFGVLSGGGVPLGPPMAAGGRVFPNLAHPVDFDNEIFVPDVPGRVLNANQLAGMKSGGIVINQSFSVEAGLPPMWEAQLGAVVALASSKARQDVEKNFGGRR
jgi:hypothetical protein